jgi:hypothetical protein
MPKFHFQIFSLLFYQLLFSKAFLYCLPFRIITKKVASQSRSSRKAASALFTKGKGTHSLFPSTSLLFCSGNSGNVADRFIRNEKDADTSSSTNFDTENDSDSSLYQDIYKVSNRLLDYICGYIFTCINVFI